MVTVPVMLMQANERCLIHSIIALTGSIPFAPGHGPFVICDYGTADGVNSLSLMTNCIGKFHKRCAVHK